MGASPWSARLHEHTARSRLEGDRFRFWVHISRACAPPREVPKQRLGDGVLCPVSRAALFKKLLRLRGLDGLRYVIGNDAMKALQQGFA